MSDSTPTLERVAQAIYAQAPDIRMMNSLQSTLSWDETSEWMREQCRRQARAALDASGNELVEALIPSAETLAKMGRAAENELLSELGHYDAGKAAWLAWQLAELGEMPDEEIDTSDIPEVTDWTSAVRGKFAPKGHRHD